MTDVDVQIPSRVDAGTVTGAIERACTQAGLRLTLKTALASHPGCTHWHYKRGDARGILEITWWPAGPRLWLSVQDGRTGDWIDAAIARLVPVIERALRG
jgi:hypothetical protein